MSCQEKRPTPNFPIEDPNSCLPNILTPQGNLRDFALSEFSIGDFLSTFGCGHMENKVRRIVNEALKENRMPQFKGDFSCACEDYACNHTEETIIKRLKECGIWYAIEAKIAFKKFHNLTKSE